MGMGLGILGQSRAEAAEPVYAGIDISRYQGTVDFDRVAADGIDIVYMRAGEGNDYIDPEYERNYQQAREAGLKSGAYLYVTATTVDEGREQAKFFASLLQGKEFACRPVMDFENLRGLNRQTANDIALAFLQTLEEETGVTPAIYTLAPIRWKRYGMRTWQPIPFGSRSMGRRSLRPPARGRNGRAFNTPIKGRWME